MIILGVGSGRTGTASLSHLINAQKGAVCFHELNPSGVVYEGNPQPVLNTINEFQRILDGGDRRMLALDYSRPRSVQTYEEMQQAESVTILGDIAYYYLRYVDDILDANKNVRFICIKRDREETVQSWMNKTAIRRWPSLWLADRIKSLLTRTPFYQAKNHWQEHDGSVYQLDPVWDSTFPNFAAESKREAIGKYWDYYYQRADTFARQKPEFFKIFPIEKMSSRQGQSEILDFIGIPLADRVLRDQFHDHKSAG